LSLEVNAGPLAIVKVFLANADNFPAAKIAVLKERMEKFVNRCEFALKMNGQIVGDDQKYLFLAFPFPGVVFLFKLLSLREYQKAMTEAFYKFKAEAQKHLDLSS